VLEADVVLMVQRPTLAEVALLRPGAALIATLQPLVSPALIDALAERRTTSFSMDMIPRVTRAQPMDSLSSQSNIAGYKAVLVARERAPQILPDAHHRRRDRHPGAGPRARRRRGGAPSHRHGPATRCGG